MFKAPGASAVEWSLPRWRSRHAGCCCAAGHRPWCGGQATGHTW